MNGLTQETQSLLVRGVLAGASPLILADWLEEHDDSRADVIRVGCHKHGEDWFRKYGMDDLFLDERLRGYDLAEMFGYAGEPNVYGSANIAPALPNDDISIEPFSRYDVKRVIAYSEGQNDGNSWLMVGELWDGRFFFLSAGCDFTGWD